MSNIDEFLARVIDRFEVTELVEALGLTSEDIVDRFFDEITTIHGESIFDYFED